MGNILDRKETAMVPPLFCCESELDIPQKFSPHLPSKLLGWGSRVVLLILQLTSDKNIAEGKTYLVWIAE